MTLTNIGANQTMITTFDGKQVFFSYNTPVAAYLPGVGYVVTETKHSATTSKHINAWAGKGCDTRPQSFFDALTK
ncbi:hypothetical protein EXT67_20555 [Pectobacterium atrosepticum]|uniref:DUF8033 domain-containing protein n=1 Tax=Pectobacterium phage phiTE TaxID=1116482 RepID=K9L3R5_9CAUD|nr:hypothetical protein [Pectobacterium atrosepticum]YP_007392545.1 hypothetical protein phiTE_083 [Pectobacterium phage phiTE]AEZ66249.1 hypothetical protein phiTE_083 [Pectobacterium phage phiTE]MCL6318698.1 hypothetical protein [Pectobacterium atrosepticum]